MRPRWRVVDRREEAAAAREAARAEKRHAASLLRRAERVAADLAEHGRVNGFAERVRLAFEEAQ